MSGSSWIEHDGQVGPRAAHEVEALHLAPGRAVVTGFDHGEGMAEGVLGPRSSSASSSCPIPGAAKIETQFSPAAAVASKTMFCAGRRARVARHRGNASTAISA